MSSDVNVFIEIQNGDIRKIAHQLVTAAQPLAKSRGGKVRGVLVGADLGGPAAEAASLPFDDVVVIDSNELSAYTAERFTAALFGAHEKVGGGSWIFGNTSIGKELAPRVAQRLGLGMISDVVETISAEGSPVFKRPVYAGKAYGHIQPTEPYYVLSVRANSYPSAEPTGAAAPINQLDVALPASDFKVKVKEVIEREKGKVDLTEADIIVSGGMGVKGPEGFEFLKPLVEVLGAAMGSSRAAVLAGYIHPSHQVGQTGKTVSPSLYIACGISGAIQHKAGMSTSKCIVAINSDKDAPIYEFADYGIVGDLFEVIPPLTEEFKKLLGK